MTTTAAFTGGSALADALSRYFEPAAPGADTGARIVTTACGVCSPACGIRATVQDGALRFLEGLPGDQSGAGHLCGKGASGGGFLYDVDRLKYPMRRTNPKKGFDEDPGWVRISWQEALDTIANRFGGYIKNYGAESLLFVTLPSPDLWSRFMNALGIVNRIDHIDVCFQTDRVIQKYTTGGKTFANDFENSKYILLFGWDLVGKAKLAYANGVLNAKDKGAKIVHFSPTYTTTSRVADEWYPIRPGSDLAVALAMINVIVSENLYHRDFAADYTNFPDFENQIRSHFQQYTPEWAAGESDVPADAIQRIAREFAASGAGIVPAHKKTLCANYANATQLVHAISILNILAGTVDRPGGRYFPRTIAIPAVDAIYPPPKYPAKSGRRVDGRDKLPLVHEQDTGLFSTLADGMLNRYPGMIRGAFWNAYTILAFPDPKQMERAMKNVEFTVVMDFLPTDTASLADIVLPSTTYLEVSDLIARDYIATQPQVVARQAVVPPMFETKSIGWVAVELGKRMAPEFFKKPDGAFINPAQLLDEKTKRAGLGESFAEFAKTGVYTKQQMFQPRTAFATPTGKCQIYVPQFKDKGADPLPGWTPKRELPSDAYPYYYLTYIPAIHRRNTTQNNALLNEIMPTNAAVLNPALAAKLGIKDGQSVRVRSRVGSIEVPAHLSEIIRPDAVMVAHGFGHRSRLLSKSGGRGVRDGDIVPQSSTDEMLKLNNWAGSSCIMDAVVAVEPL
ncbi:MAG TPA: molybdopterin-dependent oxidoreductase [Bryobacteraceae bacterium]|nr:molybdopterin-dependent oxidoreductase [Bryobacteraceae bacterium]